MTALFVGVEELAAEGVVPVLARAAELGVDSLAISLAYHAARDVTPHSPQRVTWRRDGIHFDAEADAFSDLVPARATDDTTIVPSALVEARERGLEVLGWAVFLHNEALGSARSDVSIVNCFGGRAALADLCPSHPAVRGYCVELARAIAATGVRTVLAETLHFAPFGHGYHHERAFVELGSLAEFALGLCFCRHCIERAAACGVEPESAQAAARRLVDASLAGDAKGAICGEGPLTLDGLRTHGGDALADYALARRHTVTSLVAEVAAALEEVDARLCFLDLTGAYQGYDDGLPEPATGLDDGWRYGIDAAAVSEYADYGILAYARDPQRVADETLRYRGVLADSSRLRVLVRPGAPDCDEVANLTAKVRGARAAGAVSVDFYHYGLLPFPVLERIPQALATEGSP